VPPATLPPGPAGGAAAAEPKAAAAAASEAFAKATAAAAARAGKSERVPAVPLIAALDEASLAKLVDLMTPEARRAGEVVVEEGADATSLFLVARGQLAVTRGGEPLSRLTAGAFFGEIALLSGARRTARVVADAAEVWLLEVPKSALEAAAQKAPELADVLARHARARLLANTMRTSEIFRRLAVEERDSLSSRFESQLLADGTRVVAAGEESAALHVIVSGAAKVRQDGRLVATLGPGDVFGEMSLVGRRPATADVVASGRTVTLALGRAAFDDVAVAHPEILAEVFKLLVAREEQNRVAEAPSEHHELDEDDLVV
jgi:CRP-like cAMP-binding protein